MLLTIANKLKSPIVRCLGSKEYVGSDNPFDVRMTGLIGFSSGYHAMLDCDTLLMLGTDFPYRPFYPTTAKVVQVDRDPGALGRRIRLELGVIGDVAETVRALLPRLKEKSDQRFLQTARKHYM